MTDDKYAIPEAPCGPNGHTWTHIADGARCYCGAEVLIAQERDGDIFFHVENGPPEQGIFVGSVLMDYVNGKADA